MSLPMLNHTFRLSAKSLKKLDYIRYKLREKGQERAPKSTAIRYAIDEAEKILRDGPLLFK
jgi:hypothetical protein